MDACAGLARGSGTFGGAAQCPHFRLMHASTREAGKTHRARSVGTPNRMGVNERAKRIDVLDAFRLGNNEARQPL